MITLTIWAPLGNISICQHRGRTAEDGRKTAEEFSGRNSWIIHGLVHGKGPNKIIRPSSEVVVWPAPRKIRGRCAEDSAEVKFMNSWIVHELLLFGQHRGKSAEDVRKTPRKWNSWFHESSHESFMSSWIGQKSKLPALRKKCGSRAEDHARTQRKK